MQEHIASLSPVTVVTRTTIARSRVLAGTVALFAVTMFTGASLLFLVQPMFAKLALPRLGGSPSVWNTCVLFFQATLLLGYLYAHFSTRWLGVRRQIYLHLLLLIVPFVALPLTMGDGQPSSASPIWWLLGTMTLSVGLPFFVVSTTAPLLQRWFATLPVPSARDPYFLYAASNLGSMLALLAYPFLLEPAIGTRQQTWLWTIGYIVLVALTAACAMAVRACANEEPGDSAAAPVVKSQPLSAGKRLRWVILSFIPSSLMLGVTTHISTDVAAVPLLWVLPLAMYLGTFVLAFSPKEVLPDRWLIRLLPVLIAGCLATVLLNNGSSWSIPLHLAAFFVCAMVCHRELANHRPDARHLTEFYIWMSFGGMLGGVFNGLIAPQIFSRILEYPLVLALATLATPSAFRKSRPETIVPILGVSAFVVLLILGLWATGLMAASLGIRELLPKCGIVFMAVSLFLYQPRAFRTMSLVFVGVIAVGVPKGGGTVLLAARSFFGVYRVIDAPNHGHHRLQHGSTIHGRQEMPADASCEPTSYFHPSNPIGQLFTSGRSSFERVAVVGLGSGALACYAEPGHDWTFYEIDPLMESYRARSTQLHVPAERPRSRERRARRRASDPSTRDTRVVRPDRPGRVQLRRHTGSSSDTRSSRTVHVATQNRWRRGCPHLEPIPEARTRPRGARTTAWSVRPRELRWSHPGGGREQGAYGFALGPARSEPRTLGASIWATRLVFAEDE